MLVLARYSEAELAAEDCEGVTILERYSVGVFAGDSEKMKRQTVLQEAGASGETGGACGGAAVGASQTDLDESGSDSDVDASMHDFTSEGTLPEALTSMHVVKTPQERAAQLAADVHEVRSVVGMADINARYPKDLHFFHQADTSGERSVTYAMLLLPTGTAEGIKMPSLEESVGLRYGTYQEVPVPTDFINVSKKAALQVKRKMAEEGRVTQNLSTTASPRYAATKIQRAQLGVALHENGSEIDARRVESNACL